MKIAARLAIALASALALGCNSETKLRVQPEVPDAYPKAANPLPCRVALLVTDPMTPEENPMIGGARADVTRDFVAALRDSGLFREVQYPVLSTHRFEMTMEVEQRGRQEQPASTTFVKCGTILTLGLIAPFTTCSTDSHVETVVRLKIRSETVATYTAKTDVRFSYHYGWKNPDQTKSLGDCVAATHAQIVRKMIDDQERLAGLLAATSTKGPGS